MTDCIFCKIITKEASGSFVYEDEQVVAFMDINQPNPYKVLVVPRVHAPMIYDLTDVQAAAIMQVAVKLSRVIREVSKCEGLSVFQSNGRVANQEVFHFHLHLLPRHENDNHASRRHTITDRATLDKLAADLRAALH